MLKQLEAGRTAADMAREIGVSKHTIYAWKAQFGGMEMNEAEELRSLRDQNQRLKKLVADLSLDKEMLKSVIQKTDTARGFEGAAPGKMASRFFLWPVNFAQTMGVYQRHPTRSLRFTCHR